LLKDIGSLCGSVAIRQWLLSHSTKASSTASSEQSETYSPPGRPPSTSTGHAHSDPFERTISIAKFAMLLGELSSALGLLKSGRTGGSDSDLCHLYRMLLLLSDRKNEVLVHAIVSFIEEQLLLKSVGGRLGLR